MLTKSYKFREMKIFSSKSRGVGEEKEEYGFHLFQLLLVFYLVNKYKAKCVFW